MAPTEQAPRPAETVYEKLVREGKIRPDFERMIADGERRAADVALRDRFAMAAPFALITHVIGDSEQAREFLEEKAALRYRWADAMMAARVEKEAPPEFQYSSVETPMRGDFASVIPALEADAERVNRTMRPIREIAPKEKA